MEILLTVRPDKATSAIFCARAHLGPEHLRLALQVGQAHAADARHRPPERQVHHLLAQAIDLPRPMQLIDSATWTSSRPKAQKAKDTTEIHLNDLGAVVAEQQAGALLDRIFRMLFSTWT